MNSKRIIAILFATVMLGTVVLAMVPSGSAQLNTACGNVAKPALSITNPQQVGGPAPIKPVTGQGQVKFDVEYLSQQGYSVTPVLVTVTVTPQDQGFTSITWSPSVFAIEMPAQPGGQPISDSETITVDFAFTQDAPAFKPTRLNIQVTASEGTCVEAPDQVTGQSPQLSVGFYESYQARFDKSIHKTGQNAQVTIPMVLQNFGNGDIQVNFALAENSASSLATALPPPVIVRSLATGGETDTANIPLDVQTPFKNGYENRRDTLILNIGGNSVDDIDTALKPVQLTAVVQTQGVYVPGFEAVTMLTALIGALFVARRRL